MTSLHDDALAVLQGWIAPSPQQDEVRRDYVRHLEQHPDGLARGCFPDHVTASTLIVSADHSHVLLTLHAKANAWFQMGGHCEPEDRSLAGAALREAAEESGIGDLALDLRPVQLDVHEVGFCNPRGTVRHLDVRFLALAPETATYAISEESLDVRWWPVDRLPTPERGLGELVAHALTRLSAQSTTSSRAI